MCKDAHSPYPRVFPCSEVPVVERDHTGVGISVNKDFKNVNWVAVPGYDLFTHGVTPNADHVDQAAIDEMIKQALDKKIYFGLRAKDGISRFEFGTPEYEKAVAKSGFHRLRDSIWSRLKMCSNSAPEAELKTMADYLNSRNQMYAEAADKTFEYHWSMLYDNCSHVSNNALAAIGVRDEIKVNRSFFVQIGNLAVLGTDYRRFKRLCITEKIDFDSVYGDARRWKALFEKGFLPTGFGALSIEFSVYANNDFYHSDLGALALPAKPLFKAMEFGPLEGCVH